MASIKVACVILMCMFVVSAPIAQANITCKQVAKDLAPCLKYLQSGGDVPEACCKSVKAFVESTKSIHDKKAACKCLKTVAEIKYLKIKPENAELLPQKCKVDPPFKFSTSTDCDNIKL